MNKNLCIIFQLLVLLFFCISVSFAHLCDNVFRQKDKLIVKPEAYNIVVKDKTTFKIFLQNNMDREIAEIMLLAESPAFDFTVTPGKMKIPKDARVYFEVTMVPKASTKTGRYPIRFRLVGGGREFKSFGLDIESGKSRSKVQKDHKGATGLLKVKPLLSSPIVNGELTEKCWKTAAVLSNFSSSSGGKASYQTTGLITYDKDYLHFGIVSSYDTTRHLSEKDKIIIFISKDRKVHYSLIFPAVGSPYYRKYVNNERVLENREPEGIKYSSKASKDSWTAEISIPFSILNFQPPSSREKWYLRIARVKSTGEVERSFWAADSSGYNKEKGFGEFLITP